MAMKFFGFSRKHKITKRKKAQAQKAEKILASFLTAAGWLAPLLFAAMGCYALLHADFLKIAHIHISGSSLVSQEKILGNMEIKEGDNILVFDPAQATAKLEGDPWIYRAVVTRRLPDTVEVQIQERSAVAAIMLDRLYLVDSRGDVFTEPAGSSPGLPLLTGLTSEDIMSSSRESSRVMEAALSLIVSLDKKSMLSGRPLRIDMDKVFGLSMADGEQGAKVFMGFDDYEEKLRLLQKVRDDLAEKGLTAQSIHLGSPKQAYITLSSAPSEGPGSQSKAPAKVG